MNGIMWFWVIFISCGVVLLCVVGFFEWRENRRWARQDVAYYAEYRKKLMMERLHRVGWIDR